MRLANSFSFLSIFISIIVLATSPALAAGPDRDLFLPGVKIIRDIPEVMDGLVLDEPPLVVEDATLAPPGPIVGADLSLRFTAVGGGDPNTDPGDPVKFELKVRPPDDDQRWNVRLPVDFTFSSLQSVVVSTTTCVSYTVNTVYGSEGIDIILNQQGGCAGQITAPVVVTGWIRMNDEGCDTPPDTAELVARLVKRIGFSDYKDEKQVRAVLRVCHPL